MNKRAVILDFTSLLDVIMIILFFFILFSHFETEEAKLLMQAAEHSADEREAQAQALLEEAAGLMSGAEDMNKQAQIRFEEAESAQERSGANAAAISDFGGNRNIRLKLNTADESGWSLDVFTDEKKLASVVKDADSVMTSELLAVLSDAGCKKDDTLLCMFVYDATESGTNSACRSIYGILDGVKEQYRHFYYSEIDTSLFMEE